MYFDRDEHQGLRHCRLSAETAAAISGPGRHTTPSNGELAAKAAEGEAASRPRGEQEEAVAGNGGATRAPSREEGSARRRRKHVELQPLEPIPPFTSILAKVGFPRGSQAIHLRNALGSIYPDPSFPHLFPTSTSLVAAPWRLALVTMLQVLETVPDRHALKCVRTSIDWKYALSLPPERHSLPLTTLAEFQQRLYEPEVQEQVLKPLLRVCRERRWLSRRSGHVTAFLETLERINKLADIIDAFASALDIINGLGESINMPEEAGLEHIIKLIQMDWLDRYAYSTASKDIPGGKRMQLALLEQVGRDIRMLLEATRINGTPYFLHTLPVVRTLQEVWTIYYA